VSRSHNAVLHRHRELSVSSCVINNCRSSWFASQSQSISTTSHDFLRDFLKKKIVIVYVRVCFVYRLGIYVYHCKIFRYVLFTAHVRFVKKWRENYSTVPDAISYPKIRKGKKPCRAGFPFSATERRKEVALSLWSRLLSVTTGRVRWLLNWDGNCWSIRRSSSGTKDRLLSDSAPRTRVTRHKIFRETRYGASNWKFLWRGGGFAWKRVMAGRNFLTNSGML
jgi:hypothetical protein